MSGFFLCLDAEYDKINYRLAGKGPQPMRAQLIVTSQIIHCVIATGNHRDFDSLRGAPRSVSLHFIEYAVYLGSIEPGGPYGVTIFAGLSGSHCQRPLAA